MSRLARVVVLLSRGWGQFALLQKWTQSVPYRHGESNVLLIVARVTQHTQYGWV